MTSNDIRNAWFTPRGHGHLPELASPSDRYWSNQAKRATGRPRRWTLNELHELHEHAEHANRASWTYTGGHYTHYKIGARHFDRQPDGHYLERTPQK